jgi:pyrrolysyl-tRNA synthetase-like protein
MADESGQKKKEHGKKQATRYYRKRVELFLLIDKIKLWPSRKGILHGIKSVSKSGNTAEITTHCGKRFRIYNSRNSRAARWLRNKLYHEACPACAIPQWKLEKYSSTRFRRKYGSDLSHGKEGD